MLKILSVKKEDAVYSITDKKTIKDKKGRTDLSSLSVPLKIVLHALHDQFVETPL